MAVIIDRSSKPMKEKHIAYRDIIADYPDMPVLESLNFDAKESLHDYLRDLIAWEDRKITEFQTPGEGISYYYSEICWKAKYHSSTQFHRESDSCFSSVEKAWAAFQEDWDGEEDNVLYVTITRVFIDQGSYTSAKLDLSGAILGLGSNNNTWFADCPDSLEMVFIHIPVPFEKGDLVTKDDGKPLVLNEIPHWYTGKCSYESFVSGKRGDGSDMLGRYYFIDEEGMLMSDHGISDLHLIRYFKDELKGQERFLKYLSQYIKTGDENIDWIINVFCKFKTEADFEKQNNLFGGWYIELEREYDRNDKI
jgi:hypothetical protein